MTTYRANTVQRAVHKIIWLTVLTVGTLGMTVVIWYGAYLHYVSDHRWVALSTGLAGAVFCVGVLAVIGFYTITDPDIIDITCPAKKDTP